ncbi:MAG: CDGSH iron-sulfur domain-containing protein [Armatimonadetes bacterium]|nr:CDGSH iron-sulfur domain-containing protein [Armatimonadota bacterium]
MSDVTIEVLANGPYIVEGLVKLLDANGNPIAVTKKNIALCRCGQSSEKPFCDGSHKTCGFLDPGILMNPES